MVTLHIHSEHFTLMKYLSTLGSFLLIVTMPWFFSNCIDGTKRSTKEIGWVPVYTKGNYLDAFAFIGPRTISSPGKIYVRNQYLLVNDLRQGIHVIDNSNPSSPAAIGFLKLPGNIDITMKGDVLYGDFYDGIISIDMSDPSKPKIMGFLPACLSRDRIMPERTDATLFMKYQCADSTKGVVTSWKKDSVDKEECYGTIQ